MKPQDQTGDEYVGHVCTRFNGRVTSSSMIYQFIVVHLAYQNAMVLSNRTALHMSDDYLRMIFFPGVSCVFQTRAR